MPPAVQPAALGGPLPSTEQAAVPVKPGCSPARFIVHRVRERRARRAPGEKPRVCLGRAPRRRRVTAACDDAPMTDRPTYEFDAPLWRWDARKTDSWVFVSLPTDVADDVL